MVQKKSLFISTGALLMLSLPTQAEMLNAYIGTYAPKGEGVYLTQIDSQTGAMNKPTLAATITNGAQLVYNADQSVIYVASEINNYQGTTNGAIVAYSVAQNGTLTELNQVNSEGAGPVYLSIHPSGKFLLIANYISGSIAVYPINKDGSLEKAVSVKQSTGEPGLSYPKAAAPGSFALSDHDGPHAHMISSDPSGKFVFSTDLGLDRIYQWKFNTETGELTPNTPAFIMASSEGAGPRHFVFHPKANMMYLINEEASILTSYNFDKDKGTLTEKQSISILPVGYEGTSYASGIIINETGTSLYTVNRLHNSISQFAIDKNGEFSLVDNVWTRGDYTRTITFSPDGKFIYAMNQRSDNMVRFSVDAQTGKLTFVENYVAVPAPSQMIFAK
ncbi:lactonase family protein [Zophobihabitans entericus]|uniref:Lactonase family protein n=2 Tax=Zophobihabitans entericus TaxID=1635327 RepID=A0A6G9IDR5_9GAMM|nr:lactonase family protein [Zophobihabitans entericus]